MLTGVAGTVKAFAHRVEDAGADVTIDDAECRQRQQRQTTAVWRLAMTRMPVFILEGGIFDDRIGGSFSNGAPQALASVPFHPSIAALRFAHRVRHNHHLETVELTRLSASLARRLKL